MKKPTFSKVSVGRPAQYVFIVVGVLLSLLLIRNIFNLVSSQDKIRQSQEKVAKLRDENERLRREKEQAQSPEFLEKIAREKLGLAREGETVVILPDEETLKKLAPQPSEDGLGEQFPNWKLWLRLFF